MHAASPLPAPAIRAAQGESAAVFRRRFPRPAGGGFLSFAAVLALSPPAVAEERVNHYSPYPPVVPISSGISWPAGQALPRFATPSGPLDTILVQDLTPDEQITFSALQGLINKTRPRVYLLDSGADEGTYTWANTAVLNLPNRTLYPAARKYDVIAKYAGELAGVVLYDPSISPHYRNVAGTVAGLRNAIPATPAIHAALSARGIYLDVAADLTTLTHTAPVDIYNHLYNTYWAGCDKRVIVSANPADGGDLHHTRDIAAAAGGAVVWLSTTNTSQRNVLRKFLGDMTAGEAIVLGWYTTERSGVVTATSYGIGTIPADYFISGSVYGGTDPRIRAPVVPPRAALENKAYIAVFLSDGDNAQYMQRAMRKFWDQHASSRGKVALNWTVAPGMVDLGPALLNYYYSTATANDCFVAGPSGMGYLMPMNTLAETGAAAGTHLTNEAAMDGYARLTETYMQRAGLRVLTVWDNANAMHRASYERNVRNLYGATVQRFSGNSSVLPSIENRRLRFDRLVQAYAGSYTSMRDALDAEINAWDGSAPLFLSIQVNIWNEMKPNRIVDLRDELAARYPGKLEFVRADHYFNFFNEANHLPFNLPMAARTSVTAEGGGSPALAGDGTPATLWTSAAAGRRSLTFDFGAPYNLKRYVIRHAGDAGAARELNTRDFRVQVSAGGESWSTIDTRTGNETSVTDVEFPPVTARYARLLIDHPGGDGVARIADVELFGSTALEIFPPEPDPSFYAWMEALPDDETPPEGQQGPHDQPAGDGMSNLLKYALGLKPLVPAAGEGLRMVAASGETLALEVTRAKTSATRFSLEGSTDLGDWQAIDHETEWREDLAGDRERVRFVVDRPADGTYFLRLRIGMEE